MKKYSKLALMLALMLSMSTVMAACDDPGDKNHENPPTQEELDNIKYKAAVAEWEKYVEYVAPATPKKLEKTTLKTQKEDKSLSYEGDYYTIHNVVKTEKTFTDETATEPVSETKTTKLETTKTYYDSETHEELFKTVIVNVMKDGDKALDTELKPTAEYAQGVSKLTSYILQVSKTTKVLKTVEEGADPLDETLFSSYEEKTVYSYYHLPTKTWIAENLETAAVKRDNVNIAQQIIDIEDKTYLFDKATGEVVATYDLGMEYAVPSFDASNPQCPTPVTYDPYTGRINGWNASGYGYYEQDEYAYYIKEAEPQIMPVGDIAMTLMPEVSFTVYSNGEIKAEYVSDAYAVAGYAVLPNGNIYICEYEYTDAEATEYDANLGGQKINIVHTILNVETGATTDVNNAFLANKVYTNATEAMTTFNSYLTIGSANETLGSMQLKDGYVLSEIQKHSNGALEGTTSFAVLSAETMEIVAELPKIVPNQFGYVGYLDKNTMFVQAQAADRNNTILNYAIDVATGNLELFMHNFSNVQFIDNGFIYEDAVYDYNMNKLVTLDDHDNNSYNCYESYQVIGGKVLVQVGNGWDVFGNFFESYTTAWAWASIKEVQEVIGESWHEGKEYPEFVYKTTLKWVVENPFEYVNGDFGNESGMLVTENLYQITYSNGNVVKYFALDGTEYDFNLGLRQETKTVTYEENSYTFYYDVVRTAIPQTYANGMVSVSVVETWTLNTSMSPSTLPEGMAAPDAVITYTEAYLLK